MVNQEAQQFKLDYVEVPDVTLVTGEGPLGTCERHKYSSAHGVSKEVTESILYSYLYSLYTIV